MRSSMKKTTVREIKGSFGRYFAILAIIALGVGFFCGVRITTPAMVNTINSFYDDHQLYDYRIVSSIGWTDEDAAVFSDEDNVRACEGAYSLDVIFKYPGSRDDVFKAHSITDKLNTLELVSGRMPQSSDECVVDADKNGVPKIGEEMILSEENSEDTSGSFSHKKYKVVGTVYSPQYINFERGTTSIGNGSVTGFVYMPPEAFSMKRYTEIYVRLDHEHEIYSSDYKEFIKSKTERWEELASECANKNAEAMAEEMGLPQTPVPTVYVLDRNYNIGYSCFESDSEIVEQVARVFPIFFILVAALVCMTTMSRMIEEQRTQIGVLKALGYSDLSIMGKYLFYSGSAALIGCIIGYVVGIILFPGVIWMTYQLMYIKLPMKYIFDVRLAAAAVGASLLCSLGVTWLSCRHELAETSASLMRAKAPKAGKRVLLERIPFIWNHLKFLYKVSVRNIFRYKKRFFMMILGISGCTALLLTGFGLKDSISGFAEMQYEKIITADAELTFRNDSAGIPDDIKSVIAENTDKYAFIHSSSWDLLYGGDKVKNITLVSPESFDSLREQFIMNDMNGEKTPSPDIDEAIVSNSIAERYNAKKGDTITLRSSNMKELNVRVAGVFENHVYNYVFVAHETLEKQLLDDVSYNGAYIDFLSSQDTAISISNIAQNRSVISITRFEEMKTRLSKMMGSLNYIVLLIIFSAAGLAFVVIYNLTNINITERLREIATIKVLGFFDRETSAYVLRENISLTALGTAVGLVLGVLLHKFVMAQIVVDLISFSTTVTPMSFAVSAVLTFTFNFIVNIFMKKKLDRINMAESLKSIE